VFGVLARIDINIIRSKQRKEINMADCELLAGCLFFNDKMKDDEGLGAMYKKKYCLGDNSIYGIPETWKTCCSNKFLSKYDKSSKRDSFRNIEQVANRAQPELKSCTFQPVIHTSDEC
jgi:hypothetical protein